MRFIDDDLLATMREHDARRSIFLHLETETPLAVWSGVGSIAAQIRDVTIGDVTFRGGALLTGMDTIRQIINGAAERIDFTLPGVDAQAAALIEEGAEQVQGKLLHIGLAFFDEGWNLVTKIIPVGRCTADTVSYNLNRQASREQPRTADVSLSCHYGEVDRSRARQVYWTAAHQRLVDPLDKSCNYVYSLQKDHTLKWPRA